ncbi:MAG: DUF4301 family protein [Chlorobi bacterium]|nr:DUF4301 family protein [Chlorobiota bacterium]
MFTEKDIKQFKEKNITEEQIKTQIKQFEKGFKFMNIIAPSTVGKGVLKPSEKEINRYISKYEKIQDNIKIVKFVPASGAASRMFKELFSVLNDKIEINEDKSFNSAYIFIQNIEKFAFFEDLKNTCGNITNFKTEYKKVFACLLTENGLNYGNLPKGLLKFHKYNKDENRTPVQEHLAEGAKYASSKNNVFIHFTVSPEHKHLFEKHIEQIKEKYEIFLNTKFEISYSVQKPSTDTVAVDMQNKAFRNEDGTILFRPGGHGALIENLNDIEADIIFVKNIDNVVPDKLKSDTISYKKVLAGILTETINKIYSYIKKLYKSSDIEIINEIKDFLKTELFITLDKTFDTKSNAEKAKYLRRKLNRPLRVCGMVKNEGEPGGGPFFVQKPSGFVSLQIVESAQIDMQNPEKAEIVRNATHFNPVDLVLSVKDYKGKKFNLKKFIDPETGFISHKYKDGKDLKALELPGLWNGAMANWNTLFIEVPISTFNPVKTVNDLLRNTHQ